LEEGRLSLCNVGGERFQSDRRGFVHVDDYWNRLGRVTRFLGAHREPDRSFADFLAERPGGHKLARERSLASQWVRGFQAADPGIVSERARAEGASPGEEEERAIARCVEGYASVVNLLAADVPDIPLGAAVSRVQGERGEITVSGTAATDGFERPAAAAIITSPVPLLSNWGQ